MFGGFKYARNSLIILNVFYFIIGVLLIGLGGHWITINKISSLPIIGGVISSGVFLSIISVVGLIGAVKHHQVLLFFYMVILLVVFLIQFSIACACLAVSTDTQKDLVKTGWTTVNDKIKHDAQMVLSERRHLYQLPTMILYGISMMMMRKTQLLLFVIIFLVIIMMKFKFLMTRLTMMTTKRNLFWTRHGQFVTSTPIKLIKYAERSIAKYEEAKKYLDEIIKPEGQHGAQTKAARKAQVNDQEFARYLKRFRNSRPQRPSAPWKYAQAIQYILQQQKQNPELKVERQALAAKLNIHPSTLSAKCREAGLSVREQNNSENIDALNKQKKLKDQGINITRSELGKKLNKSQQAISLAAKKHGFDIQFRSPNGDDSRLAFGCCGFKSVNITEGPDGHPSCKDIDICTRGIECSDPKTECCSVYNTNCSCPTCAELLEKTTGKAFSVTGGVSLFFSFTEIFGAVLAGHYRNIYAHAEY